MAIRWGVTVVAVVFVVTRVDWATLGAALRGAGAPTLLPAVLLALPSLWLKFERWRMLLHSGRYEATRRDATLSVLAGMGLALITPSRLGELGRPLYLPDRRKWEIAGLAVADKAFDALAIGGAATIGIGVFFGPLLAAALALTILMAAATMIFVGMSDRLRRVILQRRYLGGRLAGPMAAAHALSAGVVARCFAVSVAIVALTTVQFAVLLHGLAHIPPAWALLVYPVVVVATMLPVSANGIGIREATAAILLGNLGANAGISAIAASLMFIVNLLVPGVIGLLIVGRLWRPAMAAQHDAVRSQSVADAT